jgi:cholesterol transport system auxiliary component
MRAQAVFLAALLAAASGCALLTKQDAMTVRYFSPEHARAQLTAADGGRAEGPGTPLRLGRVTAGTHLRERIVYRDAAYELGFYDDRRWTERPDAYVRRELSRALFEERGFSRVLSAMAPTLEVEVVSFEEHRRRDGTVGRVELRVLVHDDATVLLEESITVERPVTGGTGIEHTVAALGAALGEAARQVAERVTRVAAR